MSILQYWESNLPKDVQKEIDFLINANIDLDRLDSGDKKFYFSDDLVASWWFRKVKNLKIIENCFRQEQSCRKNREDYHLDKYAIHKGANGATSRFGFDWPMYQKTYKILKKL